MTPARSAGTSPERFDTIVVGARCAGAPLATHLARAGQKVLLLDSAKLPSDHPLSTHFVSPIGVEWLDDLGVGAEVRRLSPPSCVIRMDLDGVQLDVPFKNGRAGHCLRRLHLDRLLQEAAAKAGAILRDQTKVVDLIREDGRVVGVEAVHAGATHRFHTAVVVGADGRHSTVAELAGAKEYLGYDTPRFGYWAYWPALPAWTQDPSFRDFDAYTGFAEDGTARFIFQTDANLLILGVLALTSELPSWKGRYEAAYLERLRSWPVTAPLVEGNQREGKVVGLLSSRCFFREAAGPGFALLGDAGLHKDPTPGLGITDALRDARNLGRAILSGGDEALVRYWRQRDVDSIDLFCFAGDMGDPSFLNPLNQLLFEKARHSPALMARLAAQADRELSPYEVVPPGTVLGWVIGAALRGRLSVVPSFFAAARRGARAARARRERVGLLEGLSS
ncbi:MAG: NAD(P)/FAD-dependent oxidoreductase [Polyangiaceae bacterium]|jgi:menaquinone-9 beta-reductase